MAILLGILKIIGIILLAVLGILVLTLLYLLFFPIHLQMYAAHETEWMFRVKLQGFLRFFQVRAEYLSGELIWSVRAFWGRWILFPREETEEQVQQAQPKEREETPKKQEEAPKEQEEVPKEQEEASGKQEEVPGKQEPAKEQRAVHTETKEKSSGQKHEKIKRDRGETIPIKEKFQNMKITRLTPDQKRAIRFLWQEMIWYLKKIRPRLTKADAAYSLGDPAYTGELTGVLSLWPSVYGKNIRFCPDFESDDPYFQGYIQIESKFYMIHLVRLLGRIYFNKDCKKLFHL